MQATHTAISLELSLDGDALSGLASVENGESRPFSGWLGLVSAIEALIATNPEGEEQ
jgi:hypothetical protein